MLSIKEAFGRCLHSKVKKRHLETMCKIMASGFSRIPIYNQKRHLVCGLLLVKKLIALDPSDARPISQIGLRAPLVVTPSTPLFTMLRDFRMGRSHLAIVTHHVEEFQQAWHGGRSPPEHVQVLGIITIEDVIEELIHEEIHDELDNHEDRGHHFPETVHHARALNHAVTKFKSLLHHREKSMRLRPALDRKQ